MIPFLPDQRLWGGTGGLRRGQLHSGVCDRVTAVEKPVLAAESRHVPNQALASYRGKNAPGARFFWEKWEDAGKWITQTLSIQIPLAQRHHL